MMSYLMLEILTFITDDHLRIFTPNMAYAPVDWSNVSGTGFFHFWENLLQLSNLFMAWG